MKRAREEEQKEGGEEEGMYFFDQGMRRVTPYWHTFTLNIKQRMMGQTILKGDLNRRNG